MTIEPQAPVRAALEHAIQALNFEANRAEEWGADVLVAGTRADAAILEEHRAALSTPGDAQAKPIGREELAQVVRDAVFRGLNEQAGDDAVEDFSHLPDELQSILQYAGNQAADKILSRIAGDLNQ